MSSVHSASMASPDLRDQALVLRATGRSVAFPVIGDQTLEASKAPFRNEYRRKRTALQLVDGEKLYSLPGIRQALSRQLKARFAFEFQEDAVAGVYAQCALFLEYSFRLPIRPPQLI